jgi:hypothetical protein
MNESGKVRNEKDVTYFMAQPRNLLDGNDDIHTHPLTQKSGLP